MLKMMICKMRSHNSEQSCRRPTRIWINTEDSSHGFQSSFGGPEEQLKVLHEEYQSELVKTAEEGKRVQAELAKAYEARIRELNEHHAEELARLAESNPVNQADYDQFAPFDDSSANATNEQNEALSNQLKEAEQKLLRAESENKHLLSNYAQLEARLEAMETSQTTSA